MSALWNALERDFGRVLASTPRPDAPLPEPETVDCTDVQIGNSDLPVPSWEPPQGEPERAPLPGHEHQLGLDALDAALDELLAGINRMVSECPPSFAGAERRS